MEFATPHVFFGLPKDVGGGRPDAKLYPGYIRIYQVDIHRSKKQTAYDLCELLLLVFEDTQKRNPTSTMEFVGRAPRAVKYHGFAPLPPQKIYKLNVVGGWLLEL